MNTRNSPKILSVNFESIDTEYLLIDTLEELFGDLELVFKRKVRLKNN